MPKLTDVVRKRALRKAVKEKYSSLLQDKFNLAKKELISFIKESVVGNFDYEKAKPFREYINWHNSVRLGTDFCVEWQAAYNSLRSICELEDVYYYALPFECPSSQDGSYYFYLDKKYNKQVTAILKPFFMECLRVCAIHDDAQCILQGLSAYQQVKDIIPELYEYLPETDKVITESILIEQINRVRSAFERKQEAKNA